MLGQWKNCCCNGIGIQYFFKFLMGIYRSPDGNPEKALENLANSAMPIQDNHKDEMVLMRDFNVNFKTRNTPAYKLLKTFQRNLNLKN